MFVYKEYKGWDAYTAEIYPFDAPHGEIDIPASYKGLPVMRAVFKETNSEAKITKIKIPGCVRELGFGGFIKTDKSVAVELDLGNEFFTYDGSALYTKNMRVLLLFCARNMERFEVPEDVKVIASGAFGYARGLHEIALPEGLEKIERGAFYAAEGLREIVFPKSLRHIGSQAFACCSALESANLENVTNIGSKAFYKCGKLDNIKVTCEKILDCAFLECGSLRNITLENTRSIGHHAFSFNPEMKTPALPEGLRELDAKFIASSAARMPDVIRLPRSIEKINQCAYFSYNTVEIYFSENSKIFSNKEEKPFFFGEGTVVRVLSDRGAPMYEVKAFDNSFIGFFKADGFDFEEYDRALIAKFGKKRFFLPFSTDYSCALFRMRNSRDLSETARAEYIKYITANALEYLDWHIVYNMSDDLEKFEYYGCLTEKKFLYLIELSIDKKKPEITALLLQKKNEFGALADEPDDPFEE